MKRNLLVTAFVIALASPAFAESPTAATAKPTAAKPAIAKSGSRLDEVHIKGEIPEPQVLFVVGRERRRFLDFQHRRYIAERAATAAAAPTWVRVVDTGR